MATQIPKLLALGLLKPPFDSSLDALESLLTFGVLSQLGRMMEIQTKDLTLSNEKGGLDARLNQAQLLERLQRIAAANRVQYIWTGQLSYVLQGETSIKVNYWLYSAEHNRIVLNETFSFVREDVIEPQLPPVGIDMFNQLVNQITADCVQTINRKVVKASDIACVSNSLVAIHWAMRAYHAIRHEEKITFYETALREDAGLEVAYSNLARIYKSDHLYEKSVLCYRSALKYAHGAPRNRGMYATEAGIACALLGRSDLALQWWLKAIDYDPTFLNPYFNLANIYEDQNNLREAEKYFLKAQKLAPDDFRTYLNLARLYSKLGEWEKALAQYQRQLETEADDPWCHSDVATCYLNLGDLPNAMQHLKKTVSLDPDGEAGQYAQLILTGMSLN